MYVNVTRSQTEEPKLEYSAYATQTQQQQPTGQHLTQATAAYLTEPDLGSFATQTKEEPNIFNVSSQQQQPQQHEQQQQQQSSISGTASPSESAVSGGQEASGQSAPHEQPTLADYNQSTSKGHEILSQVTILLFYPTQGVWLSADSLKE